MYFEGGGLPIPSRPSPPAAKGGSSGTGTEDVPAKEAANMRAAPLLTIGNTTEVEIVKSQKPSNDIKYLLDNCFCILRTERAAADICPGPGQWLGQGWGPVLRSQTDHNSILRISAWGH